MQSHGGRHLSRVRPGAGTTPRVDRLLAPTSLRPDASRGD
ncbi:hypothetical protein PBI_SHRIMP_154 [Mycobacterium phage Shrimp]|uniref:Uncharacterized protein n=1 Tax=Mycobacterium phage Shrimp TaxID=1340835 RepID=T2FIR1_9CAUD|nr:hypothetical protein PBI_SHRIMP_154 [Mycobacterium phage Shrimp]